MQAMKDLKFEDSPSSASAAPKAAAESSTAKAALPRLTNHQAPPPTPVQNKVSACCTQKSISNTTAD